MQVIEYMNKVGYFQRKEDYQKCIMWTRNGIVPSFIQDDYEYYKERLKDERQKKRGGKNE